MRKFAKAALPIAAAVTVLVIGNPGYLWASVPEIDPSSGIAAMALVAGAVAVIMGRRKK